MPDLCKIAPHSIAFLGFEVHIGNAEVEGDKGVSIVLPFFYLDTVLTTSPLANNSGFCWVI